MTKQEAIDVLKSECYVFNPLNFDRTTLINTALDVAIESLKQPYDQVKWERDIAISQLEELGYSLGEKQEPCVTMRDLSEEELKHFAEEMKKVRPQVIEQEPRWIPVSARLPEAGEYVGDVDKYYLVQNEYGDMLVARYTHSEYWEQIFRFQPISDEIVAWMPLPEPYEDICEKGHFFPKGKYDFCPICGCKFKAESEG